MGKDKIFTQKISKEAHAAIMQEQYSQFKETGVKPKQEDVANGAIIGWLEQGVEISNTE
jgi:hypothetical protein